MSRSGLVSQLTDFLFSRLGPPLLEAVVDMLPEQESSYRYVGPGGQTFSVLPYTMLAIDRSGQLLARLALKGTEAYPVRELPVQHRPYVYILDKDRDRTLLFLTSGKHGAETWFLRERWEPISTNTGWTLYVPDGTIYRGEMNGCPLLMVPEHGLVRCEFSGVTLPRVLRAPVEVSSRQQVAPNNAILYTIPQDLAEAVKALRPHLGRVEDLVTAAEKELGAFTFAHMEKYVMARELIRQAVRHILSEIGEEDL